MEKRVRFPSFMRVLTVIALVSLAAWPTETRTETRPPLFTAEQEACFGRAYDAAAARAASPATPPLRSATEEMPA
jgi:hypothetical protein